MLIDIGRLPVFDTLLRYPDILASRMRLNVSLGRPLQSHLKLLSNHFLKLLSLFPQ